MYLCVFLGECFQIIHISASGDTDVERTLREASVNLQPGTKVHRMITRTERVVEKNLLFLN